MDAVPQRFTHAQMAARVARDIPEGAYVNLGIGLPTIRRELSAGRPRDHPAERKRLLGMGPAPARVTRIRI
jgi:3-oxoadipate CoA-transferase beta subunit